ncbi:phosphoglycolate phosphatase, bacterial [Alphaproteobacteria bacterium]|nr:phosphoglycolate phosphatase, bacterial [Alphaproteobacteria bacterium]
MDEHRSSPKGGVVFDLDGTLVDSAPDILAALNRLLLDYGRRKADGDELRFWLGDGVSRLVARAFDARGGLPEGVALEMAAREFRSFYSGHATDETRLFPHVAEVLEQLQEQGYRLGVCTNKGDALALEVLEGLGIRRRFSAVLGGDRSPVCKPDPAHILKTLEEMGADPARALMVGDTDNDVAAAKRAGIPVVVTSFGYACGPVTNADAVIDDFLELLSLAPAYCSLEARGGG